MMTGAARDGTAGAPDARSPLQEALARPGAWTTVYADGTGDTPAGSEATKRESLMDGLAQAGAPEADREAVATALRAGSGVASPSARYLLVSGGGIAVDEHFAGPRRGQAVLTHAALPFVIPLLRHRTYAPRYLVVETSRDGAELRLERAAGTESEQTARIEGSTDALPKVQAGGRSHARWQRHSEEVWKHNQAEVAASLERLVRDTRPAFVVLAGDLRARQLLRERLPADCTDLLIEVDAHTRADGADPRAVDRAVSEALDLGLQREIDEVSAAADAGGGERRARGVATVVEALQQARVAELLLDARTLEADPREAAETLGALDAEPWIRDGAPALGAGREVARLPVAEALARAAILTGARVRILEPALAPEEPMPDGGSPPTALLRW
ncbi:hypothetical protein MUN78_00350 [Leucobacter allii]|uniref:Peptide chain release factor 1 n=1 Tax=Leucobacter allii TaxID=2932247 RepID=A0ABY4FM93_9MICO|nr:Vms1/Ankzf1 family peptidyl-tRNA hydrolase [Leucobacter allii]UOQ57330.1 hypothetical protein MUN78_00350 [Leucobacter allii]